MKNFLNILGLIAAILLVSCKEEKKPQSISTLAVSEITATTAVCGGEVDYFAPSIMSIGICWSTEKNPTRENSFYASSMFSHEESFSCQMTDLTPDTKYYVRAYLIDSYGTGYGEQKEFTTLAEE